MWKSANHQLLVFGCKVIFRITFTGCPIGRNIHAVLDDKLARVQKAMEDAMSDAGKLLDGKGYAGEPGG